MIKNILKILFFLSILLSTVFANNDATIEDSVTTLEFSVVGDIMCHSTQFKFASVGKDSFNFKPVYREIKQYFDNSDVVIGNLETVIEVENVKYSGYPVFNTPKEFLGGLKYAGFDILSTANNHTFDIRERGIESTLKYIQKYGFEKVGTYLSQSERDSLIIHEKNGIKFALLSYTYGVNLYKIPEGKEYLVNLINENLIKNDIKKHRDAGADFVIIFFHFGVEYQREPNRYQRKLVEKTISFGADIIIGSHPHSLQPIEFFKTENGKIDSGFVAYSLGNFYSNQRWRYSDGGAVLNFSIKKDLRKNISKLLEVRYLPFWVFKGNTSNGLEYIILPSELALLNSTKPYLSDNDLDLMKECYFDTQLILEANSDNVKMDNMKRSNLRKLKRDYLENMKFISKIPILQNSFKWENNFTDTLKTIKIN